MGRFSATRLVLNGLRQKQQEEKTGKPLPDSTFEAVEKELKNAEVRIDVLTTFVFILATFLILSALMV